MFCDVSLVSCVFLITYIKTIYQFDSSKRKWKKKNTNRENIAFNTCVIKMYV